MFGLKTYHVRNMHTVYYISVNVASVFDLSPNLYQWRLYSVSVPDWQQDANLVYVCVYTCCVCGMSPVRHSSDDPKPSGENMQDLYFCWMKENNAAIQQRTDHVRRDVGHSNKIKHPVYFQNKNGFDGLSYFSVTPTTIAVHTTFK